MIPRSTSQRGVTFLEMLVAMALVGLVTAMLMSAMQIGFRAHRAAREQVDPVRAGRIALEIVRRDVESALPPTGILAGPFQGEEGIADDGALADTVEFFVSRGRRAGTGGNVAKVAFAIVAADDASGKTLVRRVTENLLAQEVPEPTDEVLCRNVAGMTLRYYDGTDWLTSWDSTAEGDYLPLAVEVTLTFSSAPGSTASTGTRLARIFLPQCVDPNAASALSGVLAGVPAGGPS